MYGRSGTDGVRDVHNRTPRIPQQPVPNRAELDARLTVELAAVVTGARRRALRDGDRQIDTAHLLHSLIESDPAVRRPSRAAPNWPGCSAISSSAVSGTGSAGRVRWRTPAPSRSSFRTWTRPCATREWRAGRPRRLRRWPGRWNGRRSAATYGPKGSTSSRRWPWTMSAGPSKSWSGAGSTRTGSPPGSPMHPTGGAGGGKLTARHADGRAGPGAEGEGAGLRGRRQACQGSLE